MPYVICGRETVALVTAVDTNAVVAMFVLTSPVPGVGAFGAPVNVGLAIGASPDTDAEIAVFLLVTSCVIAELYALFSVV